VTRISVTYIRIWIEPVNAVMETNIRTWIEPVMENLLSKTDNNLENQFLETHFKPYRDILISKNLLPLIQTLKRETVLYNVSTC